MSNEIAWDDLAVSAYRDRVELEMLMAFDVLSEKTGLSQNISPICGWAWLVKHERDLDGFVPTIELSDGHSYHKITGTSKAGREAIKAFIKG